MTAAETLTNLGKLFGFVAVAMFLMVTALAQWTYWTKDAKRDYPQMPKKYKMLYKFGFYEAVTFGVVGGTFLAVALANALWWLVTNGWGG